MRRVLAVLVVASLGLGAAAANSEKNERFDSELRSKCSKSRRKRMMNSNSQGRGKWGKYSLGFLPLMPRTFCSVLSRDELHPYHI